MRFTPHEEGDFAKFVDFVTRLSCQCLIVRHDADEDVNRPHCHLVINFDKTLSTFRQQFKKKFPDYEGNKDYQLKDCSDDGEKPLWYICKYESPVVLYKMNYTENDIERFHTESNNYVDALKKQKQTENVKPQKEYKEKKKIDTFPQRVAKEILEKYKCKPRDEWDWRFSSHRDCVYGYVLRNLGELGKVFDKHIIHRHMNGVMNIINPNSIYGIFKQECVHTMYDHDSIID